MFFHVDPDSPAGKIIMVVGVPLFIAFLHFEAIAVAHTVQSRSWPVVSGVVSDARTKQVSNGHGSQSSARITFNYTVDGTSYHSTKVQFGIFHGSLTPGHASRLLRRYPTGAAVQVAYSKGDPAISCLEP